MSSTRYNVLSDDLNSMIVVGLQSLQSEIRKVSGGFELKAPVVLIAS